MARKSDSQGKQLNHAAVLCSNYETALRLQDNVGHLLRNQPEMWACWFSYRADLAFNSASSLSFYVLDFNHMAETVLLSTVGSDHLFPAQWIYSS